jgi:hypothetical protein
MNDAFLSPALYGFATELRQLAHVPDGHEDPLVRMNERMINHAQEEATRQRPRKRACMGGK